MILVKTEAGQQAFRDRTVRLTPRQRSAFILCDGKRTIEEVQAAGMSIEREDLDQMIELGLLGPLDGAPVVTASAPVAQAEPPPVAAPTPRPALAAVPAPAAAPADGARSPQQRYKDAYPIATRLSGSLGLRGFRLNLSVEGTSNYEELLALAPKIRAAVGPDKAAEFDRALLG
ncbi:hypothetical protein QTH89_12280 [Variovorax sp. J22G21]|uniref:hypothetical protein n=1 Tax=Variovorax fucosicus TaxID=3053517 RepID=UPI0025769D8E|nr:MULTISPECIES: hypothetical protein [unclassified Variovorax]MDM0040608.1 hypothetical protein [Variovorax sp. J22R193]MDM0061981.1 hypothetical protein [Variovorax sp. J22G21]